MTPERCVGPYLGSTESSYVYAMEIVAGKTLEEMISTAGPLSLKLSLEIIGQVTSALAAAHQAGLVHRDIKPANLTCRLRREESPRR